MITNFDFDINFLLSPLDDDLYIDLWYKLRSKINVPNNVELDNEIRRII